MNAWTKHMAWLSIIFGMGSLMIIPLLLFASLFNYPGGWSWIKAQIDSLVMFIVGNSMAVVCVITAFLSVRKEPKLRLAKTAVVVAVLVILSLLPCNLIIFID